MKILNLNPLYLLILFMGSLTMNSTVFASQTNNVPHWNAELYKKHAILLQQTSAVELLSTLNLDPKSKILDLGCGEGKVTVKIAEKIPDGFVEAVDLSSAMIASAKRDFASVKNINFQQMNAQRLHFTEAFDWVVSFFCLQWVINKDQAFKEIVRALKKGGKVALIMTNRNLYLLKIRNKMISSDKWKRYFENYEDPTNVIDNDSYPTYARDAGLTEISYTEKEKTVKFESKDELRNFIKMVSPAINELPSEKQEEFVDELTESYIQVIPERQGSKFYITYNLKTLLASKH